MQRNVSRTRTMGDWPSSFVVPEMRIRIKDLDLKLKKHILLSNPVSPHCFRAEQTELGEQNMRRGCSTAWNSEFRSVRRFRPSDKLSICCSKRHRRTLNEECMDSAVLYLQKFSQPRWNAPSGNGQRKDTGKWKHSADRIDSFGKFEDLVIIGLHSLDHFGVLGLIDDHSGDVASLFDRCLFRWTIAIGSRRSIKSFTYIRRFVVVNA